MTFLPAIPSENEFQILQHVSRTAAASGLYNNVGNEQKILMILLAARELGVSPMMALNGGIWNIQGKIEISARLMAAMIRKSGHSLVIKTISDKECTIEGKRADNGDCFSSSFTIEEAHRAGLIRQGGNWIKYPQDMLYARALSRLARRLFADVIGSSYVEGEIRETLKEVKCEVIENKCEEITHSPEEIEKKMLEFIISFPQEDHDLIKTYLQKYSGHWKKSLIEALEIYSDRDKFELDFSKWKKKQLDSNPQ
jgi:hypothetical protein